MPCECGWMLGTEPGTLWKNKKYWQLILYHLSRLQLMWFFKKKHFLCNFKLRRLCIKRTLKPFLRVEKYVPVLSTEQLETCRATAVEPLSQIPLWTEDSDFRDWLPGGSWKPRSRGCMWRKMRTQQHRRPLALQSPPFCSDSHFAPFFRTVIFFLNVM